MKAEAVARGSPEEIFLAVSALEPDVEALRTLEGVQNQWQIAARMSVTCRTYPLFLKNVKAFGLESRMPDDSLATLRMLSDRSRVRTALLLDLSNRLIKALARAGILAIPLKGVSVARYYPDPLLRPMEDIDLLIRSRDFKECRTVLEDFGFYAVDSTRNGVFVNPGQECLFLNEEGLQVDLHYRFFPWFEEELIYRIAASDFIERASAYLCPEDELYYLLLVLHRSRMACFWHWTDSEALIRHFDGSLSGEYLSRLVNQSPLRNSLRRLAAHGEAIFGASWSSLLGALPKIRKNDTLVPSVGMFRMNEKIFILNCVRNPFDKLRLLSAFLKWQLFKISGSFKKEFMNAHNPTKGEIHLKRKTGATAVGRWRLNEGRFVSRELDGEHIIVDLKFGEYFTIDGAGGLMFDHLVRGKPAAEIEKTILDRCPDASQAQVRKDLAGLIRRLQHQKIILDD